MAILIIWIILQQKKFIIVKKKFYQDIKKEKSFSDVNSNERFSMKMLITRIGNNKKKSKFRFKEKKDDETLKKIHIFSAIFFNYLTFLSWKNYLFKKDSDDDDSSSSESSNDNSFSESCKSDFIHNDMINFKNMHEQLNVKNVKRYTMTNTIFQKKKSSI